MQTDFEQITLDASGRNLQSFTGKLWLQRPLHFYYETDAPHNQVIVIKAVEDGTEENKKEIWFYDKDLQQVTVQAFDQQFAQTPLMLIIDPSTAFLKQHFRVKAGKRSNSGQQQFELIPLVKDQLYEKIRFHFSQDKLYEIQLEDSLGQKTVMTFENAVYNEPVATENFQLDLSDNVDILR